MVCKISVESNMKSYILYQISYIGYKISYIGYKISYILIQRSYIIYYLRNLFILKKVLASLENLFAATQICLDL